MFLRPSLKIRVELRGCLRSRLLENGDAHGLIKTRRLDPSAVAHASGLGKGGAKGWLWIVVSRSLHFHGTGVDVDDLVGERMELEDGQGRVFETKLTWDSRTSVEIGFGL